LPLGVFLVAALVFANTIGNGFTLDDVPLVDENPRLESLRHLPDFFVSDYWSHYKDSSGLYRPLVLTSFALGSALHGPAAWGHHLLNVILHAANCVLVLLLFRRLSEDRLAIAAGAVLFATHAVHTEVVAPLSGRAELLCCLFFLLSLLAYVADAGRAERRPLLYAASLAAFTLALLAKETAITLIGVLVLFDFVYSREPESRPLARVARLLRGRSLRRYAGFVAVAALYLAVRFLWLELGDPRATTSQLDNPLLFQALPWSRISALEITFRYLGLLFFPLHLSYDYSFAQIPLIEDAADPRLYGAIAGAILAGWLLVRCLRRAPAVFFALGFAVVTFSVISNLVIGIGTIMAERLLYLPSIGFCLALTLGTRLALTPRLGPRAAQTIFLALFVALTGFHAVRSFDRNRDWANDRVLMLHDLAVSPNSSKANANAGIVLIELERPEEAAECLRRAIEIWPDNNKAANLLGSTLLALGREDEAIEAYEAAVAGQSAEAEAWNNLGYLLVERGEVERGLRLLQVALELEPDEPAVLDSLGWTYFKLGRIAEARELVARAVEIQENEARRTHLDEIERALGVAALPSVERPTETSPPTSP
jgi:tetratricopeptide (TPR) repeat protein